MKWFINSAVVLVLAAGTARAVTIQMVPVGNAGNAPDTEVMNDGTTGYGSVAYSYQIGKYEVTNFQYAEFLNAKAASDPFGLYQYADDGFSGMNGPTGGITRSGSDGSYSYTVNAGMANLPVNWVSRMSAMRFVNWLQNGQGNGDTESGSYLLSDGITTRNAAATYVLPTENEWYKAAFHKNDGTTGHYFKSPNSSDSLPTAEAPPGGSNSVNAAALGVGLTEVGAYAGSISPYGTFDQGGNVAEFLEQSGILDPFHATDKMRGGSYDAIVGATMSGLRYYDDGLGDVTGSSSGGFRVALVPEPSGLGMTGLAIAALLSWRRSMKRQAKCCGGDVVNHAFLYDTSMHDLGTLSGGSSRANGINGLGQVTGESDGLAFVYDSVGGMVDLNTLIDPLSGWVLQSGFGINDAGQVTGYGTINGETHAFLLTPVPESSSLLLLTAGRLLGPVTATEEPFASGTKNMTRLSVRTFRHSEPSRFRPQGSRHF